jgi:hypothetical protein
MPKYQIQVHTPDTILSGIITEGSNEEIKEVRYTLQNLNRVYPLEIEQDNGYIYVTPGVLQQSTIRLVIEKE